MTALLVVLVIIAIIAYYYRASWMCEGFATPREKASALSRWVSDNPRALYAEYIVANPESNIVEYSKIKELYAQGKLNPANSIRALRL